jgi:hypothetical protein
MRIMPTCDCQFGNGHRDHFGMLSLLIYSAPRAFAGKASRYDLSFTGLTGKVRSLGPAEYSGSPLRASITGDAKG